jgi:cyclophilin family peptidyl-prolyl cis-trans isomerase
MTKFDPVAKGERSRGRVNPSASERRRDMEHFRLTGEHPEVKAMEDAARRAAMQTLRNPSTSTTSSANRAKCFFDLAVNGDEHYGSIVVEMFETEAPVGCKRFEKRCASAKGDEDGVSYALGCAVFKVVDEIRVVVGRRRPDCKEVKLKTPVVREGRVTHDEAGVLGMDLYNGDFTITTERAEALDSSAQPIGRVVSGLEILKRLTHRGKGEKVPERIDVVACGVIRGGADVETLVGVAARGRAEAAKRAAAEAEALRNETQADTLKRLRAESARKGVELKEMIASGMSSRAGKDDGEEPPAAKKTKKSMLDSVLLGDDDSSDSDSD